MSFFERYANSKLYTFFDFLYTIILINLLWLSLTMLGLVVFTIFPATVAVYLIVLSRGKDLELKVFRTFFAIFLREYVKSQKVFAIMFVGGALIVMNLLFYYINLDTLTLFHLIGLVVMLALAFAYAAALIHIVPVYIYFPELPPFKIVKNAFLIGFAYPLRTLLAMLSSVAIIIIAVYLQPVLPFLLMSLIALVSMAIVRKKYDTIRKEGAPLDVEDYIPE